MFSVVDPEPDPVGSGRIRNCKQDPDPGKIIPDPRWSKTTLENWSNLDEFLNKKAQFKKKLILFAKKFCPKKLISRHNKQANTYKIGM